ncbi:MAG: hypothetical protein LBR15_06105 [Methanobrevibacter sp.]|jgi:hypothetical protein|nr:hypothetical protein [Candidatus Methanovirga australis]
MRFKLKGLFIMGLFISSLFAEPIMATEPVSDTYYEFMAREILDNSTKLESENNGTNITATTICYLKDKGNMSDFEACCFLDMISFSTGENTYLNYIVNGTKDISPHDNSVINSFENQLDNFKRSNQSARREILFHGGSLNMMLRYMQDNAVDLSHISYAVRNVGDYTEIIKKKVGDASMISGNADKINDDMNVILSDMKRDVFYRYLDYVYNNMSLNLPDYNTYNEIEFNDTIKRLDSTIDDFKKTGIALEALSGVIISLGTGFAIFGALHCNFCMVFSAVGLILTGAFLCVFASQILYFQSILIDVRNNLKNTFKGSFS